MKNWIFCILVLLLTNYISAQNVGVNTTSPTELFHLRTDSSKLAVRMDNKKSATSGVNHFVATGSASLVENFIANPDYINWTDLAPSKLTNSDNTRLRSPFLNIFPEVANHARIHFNFSPTIPDTATITNITLHAEWRRNSLTEGELQIAEIHLHQTSNDQSLLSFGFERITSAADVMIVLPFKESYAPVTPEMFNLGDVYLSLINLHSVSPGQGRLEIDHLWLEVAYTLPATGNENVFWTSGVKDGSYQITLSPNLNSNKYLTIDETGTTQLKGLKIATGALAGKVLTSTNDGKAYWAALPSSNVTSLNDLIDARADANNIFIGQNAGDSITSGSYNTGLGAQALQNNTSGDYNTALGGLALQSNESGLSNTGIGFLTLSANISGINNTAIGAGTMTENTNGGNNTAVGVSALGDNIAGNHNTAVGVKSLNKNTGGYNTAIGSNALTDNMAGASNTGMGADALSKNISGNQNTAYGRNALLLNTGGSDNAASGYAALQKNTTGNKNVAVGREALFNNVANSRTTAIGYRSMYFADNTTTERMTYNTAIGYESLMGHFSININTGDRNTAVGDHSLLSNTSGYKNSSVGSESMAMNTTGYENVAMGDKSMQLNTTGYRNTAIGSEALYLNTVGMQNTAVGKWALFNNKANNASTAIGFQAMYNADNRTTNPLSTGNTALGYQALYGSVNPGVNIGVANTAIGTQSLRNNSAGSFNTAVGADALLNSGLTSRSTGVGYYAMRNTGSLIIQYDTYNTAVGYSALEGSGNISSNTGTYNTAVGDVALNGNTSGSSNTAIGAEALFANTSGLENTAVGRRSMYESTTGAHNTAMGSYSLFENTTGGFNVAIGSEAMINNTEGNFSVAVGYSALSTMTTGGANTVVGAYAGEENTSGQENTALGKGALQHNTTGNQNVAIGFTTGTNSTGDVLNQCTIVGSNSTLNTTRTNVTMLGFGLNGTFCTGNNQVLLGNSATTQIRAQITSITAYSDARIKTDIKDDVVGLAFINQLRPVSYHQDPIALHHILGTPDSLVNQIDHHEIMDTKFIGFLAQEVEAAAIASGYDFPGIEIPENEHEVYSLRYVDFIMPMTKAIQELSQENNRLSQAYESLLTRLEVLENELAKKTP